MTSQHDAAPAAFAGPAPDPALFDLRDWPLVKVRFPELDEEDRVRRILGGLERLLDQEAPFVAIWTPPSHDHDDEPHEDERASTVWIKQHRDRLNAYCKGYVYVVADEKLRDLLAGRIVTVSKKLYAFPLKIAETPAEARQIAASMLGRPA